MINSTLLPLSHLTPTGLLPPDDTTFEQWWHLADHIRNLEARKDLTFKFLWGDWLRGLSRWPREQEQLFGEAGRGEGYKLLEAKTEKPFATLKQYTWLAGCYSTDGIPDSVRGLPHLYEAHYKDCAPIKDKPARDALLWRASALQLPHRQLVTERLFLFPGLVRDALEGSQTAHKPQDALFEATVHNHILETGLALQGATLARLNGNVTEARERLQGIESDLLYGREPFDKLRMTERVRAAVNLLQPQELPGGFIEVVFSVIEAYQAGDMGLMLEGMERLAGMRGMLGR
jgi:hypothetical protein